MSRRVNLPGADELFKPTRPSASAAGVSDGAGVVAELGDDTRRSPSKRVRHDEKITIYVTADELLDLESTRLVLRREHGVAVDRGRIVRAAISSALEDFEAGGATSSLVRRLREQ